VSHLTIISIGFVSTSLLFTFPVTSVLAHTTEIAGDIAGTWHVEPNHTPKAGEPATLWVALTRKGGSILPLEQANCQLRVYGVPRRQGDEPLLQPPLQAIARERYQGIPGADVVFPNTGLYQLELGCTPKTEGDFQPFQMMYDLTVTRGTAASTPVPQESSTSQETPVNRIDQIEPNQKLSKWMIVAVILTGVLGAGVIRVGLRRAAKH
jgi:hypothetical protein